MDTPTQFRILHVEKHETVRNMLREALETQRHIVTSASNLDEALALMQSEGAQGFDAVISANNLGLTNGIALFRDLQGIGYVGKRVLYSGAISVETRDLYKMAGVDLFLSKSLPLHELLNQLGSLLH